MGCLNNTECIKIRNKVILNTQGGIITPLCAQVALPTDMCDSTCCTKTGVYRLQLTSVCLFVSVIEASTCHLDGGCGAFMKMSKKGKKEQSNWVSVSVSQARLDKCVFKGFFFTCVLFICICLCWRKGSLLRLSHNSTKLYSTNYTAVFLETTNAVCGKFSVEECSFSKRKAFVFL